MNRRAMVSLRESSLPMFRPLYLLLCYILYCNGYIVTVHMAFTDRSSFISTLPPSDVLQIRNPEHCRAGSGGAVSLEVERTAVLAPMLSKILVRWATGDSRGEHQYFDSESRISSSKSRTIAFQSSSPCPSLQSAASYI